MKPILDTLGKRFTNKIPVWFMRQAGRYLPEYIKLTESSQKSFFEIVEDTNLATEITMQPIHRFGLDAAIIFSDILFLPRAMGCNIEILKNYGPKVEPITKSNDLKMDFFEEKIQKIADLVKSVKSKIDNKTALIGFAGGVFTVAAYILNNQITDSKLLNTKLFMYNNRKEFNKMIDILTEATIIYLNKQIENGAEVIQLFDSLAGDLSEEDFELYIIKPTQKIFKNLKSCYKIGFPRGAGIKYLSYVREIQPDGVSIDYTVPIDWVFDNLANITTVQGNLDPFLLAFDYDISIKKTKEIIEKIGESNFIFNLGHGIIKNTPIENVHSIINLVRSYIKKGSN